MDRRHVSATPPAQEERQRGKDRRASGERRRHAGLLELRARREGIGGDRRRQRSGAQVARRRLLAFWRRVKP